MSVSLTPERVAGVPDDSGPSAQRSRSFDAVLVALLAAGVSLAGAARPSLWFDEAATIRRRRDR